MNMNRIVGIVLLVVGIVFLVVGINSSQMVTEKVVEGVTGEYTNKTMIYLIVGAVMVVVGGLVGFSRRGR